MKQNKWEEQLREQMAGYEQPAPEGLWHDIEQAMKPVEPKAVGVEEQRELLARRVPLRRWLSVAAVVAVLLGSGVYIYNKVEGTGYMADVSTPAVVNASMEQAAQPPKLSGQVEPSRQSVPAGGQLAQSAETVTVQPTQTQEQPYQSKDWQVQASEHSSDTSQPSKSADTPALPLLDDPFLAMETTSHQKERRRLRLSASLLASNAVGSPSSANSVLSRPIVLSRAFTSSLMGTNYSSTILLANYGNDTEHRLPVTIGASLRLSLNRHWWLESGLHYTTTHSTFKHLYGGYRSTDEQWLKYVGVPLRVGYTFWQQGCLSAYATAGGAADVCVDVDVETNGREVPMDRDRVQFLLSSSVGVSCQLVPRLSLYAQPGLNYYPDNGSRLQNIFKEKPLNIDLQLGLRFDFE